MNSVVDPRSVYIAMTICNKLIEAVCDCGASVSCLSPEIFEELTKSCKIEVKPCKRKLKAANGLPIEVKGMISVPIKIGSKSYEHEFVVLAKSEADCLLGVDFLKKNKCDPLFSRMELQLDSTTSVPMYHKSFEYNDDTVFRVVATETLSVPAGHIKVIPAHIPSWKRPPIQLCALFEPKEKFVTENISAPNILFNLSEETIPIAIDNKTDNEITIYKDTTLGFSEIVPQAVINSITNIPSSSKLVPMKPNKYDLVNVKKSADKTVPRRYQTQFASLIDEYSDVFSKSEWDLGRCDITEHKIEIEPGSRPVKIPSRRMPLHYKEDLQKKIDVFLEKDLITPCHSPYSAPAMLVPKKNGKLRLVIDYRQLNKQTIKSCWPIPSIEEIFDTLEGSAYFTSIDMSAGFHQVPLEKKSQDYTAFSTPFGSYKWLVMPMGLTGSPPTFQCLVEKVLVGLNWKICVPYIDDIIVFSKTAEEHLERLRLVFERFRTANLKVNPAKCDFFRTNVQFLGHIVSKDGLQADPSKVEAVQNFPTPKSQTDVKSFLGLASYYRRFVPNFAGIARPLHQASEGSSNFHWPTAAQDAFDTLKQKLTTTPILAFPNLQKPFILYTDASQFAMGAVLAQEQDGLERAICYASKALSKAQTKYSATRRELLALVTFTRHFRHYLLGRKFTIVTDHSALQWLHNFKDPDGITARWLEKLAPFDYEVRHRPGKSIGHADGLSRTPARSVNVVAEEHKDTSTECSEEWPNHEAEQDADTMNLPKLATRTVKANYREVVGNVFDAPTSLAHCVSADFKMSAGIAREFRRRFPTKYPTKLEHVLTPLWPQWIPQTRRYVYHLVTKQKYYNKPTYATLRASLEQMRVHAETNDIDVISLPCIGSGLDNLEWDKVRQLIQETFRTSNVRIVVYLLSQPTEAHNESSLDSVLTNQMAQAQIADEALKHVRQWVKYNTIPKNNDLQGLPRLGWQMYNQLDSLYLANDILCRKFQPNDGRPAYLQQIVPPALVTEVIASLHDSPTAGHLGTFKTTEKVRTRFYWPGFKEDIKRHIQQCEKCQKRANPPKTHRHSLVDWQPSYPFHHISIDFLGPLPVSNGNRYILLIGDHFTKWYEAIPLPNWTAATTADALLEHWICRFGCPDSLHSDRGTNFESELFTILLKKLEINKTRTTAFHPQSNAACERMNRTLWNMLAKVVNEHQTDWSHQLPYVLMAYRASVHESTGYTPHFMVFGTETALPLDLMYPPPQQERPKSIPEFVSERQHKFRKAYEVARRHSNAQQLRRNRLYNQKIHGPVYDTGEYVLLHYPVVKVGHSPKLTNPWRGPYRIIKRLNDVNFQIEEISTQKRQVVHYDRLKRYHGTVPTVSNVQSRNHTTPNEPSQSKTSTRTHQCCNSFVYPLPTASLPPRFSMQTSSPQSDDFPNRTATVFPCSNQRAISHVSQCLFLSLLLLSHVLLKPRLPLSRVCPLHLPFANSRLASPDLTAPQHSWTPLLTTPHTVYLVVTKIIQMPDLVKPCGTPLLVPLQGLKQRLLVLPIHPQHYHNGHDLYVQIRVLNAMPLPFSKPNYQVTL